ncbi:hypothetical protein EDB19DRAFT_1679699 [Suillus lakei]|nr:hypothetical protein EDB19DRAFT_1679699 [Suillus lakei]
MQSPSDQSVCFLSVAVFMLLTSTPYFIIGIPIYFTSININDPGFTGCVFGLGLVALATVLVLGELYVRLSENKKRLRHPAGSLMQYFNGMILGALVHSFLIPDILGSNTILAYLLLVPFFFVFHMYFWLIVCYGREREHLHLYGQLMQAVHPWIFLNGKNVVFLIILCIGLVWSLPFLMISAVVMVFRVLKGFCSREPEDLARWAMGTTPGDVILCGLNLLPQIPEIPDDSAARSADRGTPDLEKGLVEV